MATINSLKELLIDELKDLHNAEVQLTKALVKMAEESNDSELKQGFEEHLEQTKRHVERIEQAFKILNAPKKDKTCKAIEGLLKEGKEALETKGPDAVKDANIIGAAQRVEHYEIAAYGTARAFAEAINEEEVAELLEQTLEEEKATDKKLSTLAMRINNEALAAV